ncbi:MAG: hypothetical protein MZV65_43965 [Chromatiales bacterium]|nr:hypothetical protein [Chromatiales bacterium]
MLRFQVAGPGSLRQAGGGRDGAGGRCCVREHYLAPPAAAGRLLRLRAQRRGQARSATPVEGVTDAQGAADLRRRCRRVSGNLILRGREPAMRTATARIANRVGVGGAGRGLVVRRSRTTTAWTCCPSASATSPGETARLPGAHALPRGHGAGDGGARRRDRRPACARSPAREPVVDVADQGRLRAQRLRLGAARCAAASRGGAAHRAWRDLRQAAPSSWAWPRSAWAGAAHELKVAVATDRQRLQGAREGARSRVAGGDGRRHGAAGRQRGRRSPPWTRACWNSWPTELGPARRHDGAARPAKWRPPPRQMQVVGKRHYGRKALPPGGGGGRQADARAVRHAAAVEGARAAGRARRGARSRCRSTTRSPRFRIVAVATGGDGLLRHRRCQRSASTQDLMLLSGLPPLVREGDRFAPASPCATPRRRA